MRKLLLTTAVCLVALAAVPALASAAGRFELSGANSVSVRSKAHSFAIGTIFRGDHMDVSYIDGNNWAYGYVYGSYKGCGWVYRGSKNEYLTKSSSKDQPAHFNDKCAGRRRELRLSDFGFALGKIGSGPNGTDGSAAHLNDCKYKGYYGNYNGGTRRLAHYYGTLHTNADLRYRFTAKNSDGSHSKVALVREEGNSAGWFFVRRNCIVRTPAKK